MDSQFQYVKKKEKKNLCHANDTNWLIYIKNRLNYSNMFNINDTANNNHEKSSLILIN